MRLDHLLSKRKVEAELLLGVSSGLRRQKLQAKPLQNKKLKLTMRASANGFREGPIVTDKSAIVHAVADCLHIFFLLSRNLFLYRKMRFFFKAYVSDGPVAQSVRALL